MGNADWLSRYPIGSESEVLKIKIDGIADAVPNIGLDVIIWRFLVRHLELAYKSPDLITTLTSSHHTIEEMSFPKRGRTVQLAINSQHVRKNGHTMSVQDWLATYASDPQDAQLSSHFCRAFAGLRMDSLCYTLKQDSHNVDVLMVRQIPSKVIKGQYRKPSEYFLAVV